MTKQAAARLSGRLLGHQLLQPGRTPDKRHRQRSQQHYKLVQQPGIADRFQQRRWPRDERHL